MSAPWQIAAAPRRLRIVGGGQCGAADQPIARARVGKAMGRVAAGAGGRDRKGAYRGSANRPCGSSQSPVLAGLGEVAEWSKALPC